MPQLKPTPATFLRVIYILIIIGLGILGWHFSGLKDTRNQAIGIELLSAVILSAAFLLYDFLRDAVAKNDQKQLKDDLISTIKTHNKINSYYRFFLCPPITSYIEFNGRGYIKSHSHKQHHNIHAFSIALERRLHELTGGRVYYGLTSRDDMFDGKGFPSDCTKDRFNLYHQRLQSRHVEAIRSSQFFIAITPFGPAKSNSIFEAGIAKGRGLKSIYYYKDNDALPPIMKIDAKCVQRDDLHEKMIKFTELPAGAQATFIDEFAVEIKNYFMREETD